MADSMMVETDLFDHREVKPHFINPFCFGEDFAAWRKQELARFPELGVQLSEPFQEVYGWGLWATRGKDRFLDRSFRLLQLQKFPKLNVDFSSSLSIGRWFVEKEGDEKPYPPVPTDYSDDNKKVPNLGMTKKRLVDRLAFCWSVARMVGSIKGRQDSAPLMRGPFKDG